MITGVVTPAAQVAAHVEPLLPGSITSSRMTSHVSAVARSSPTAVRGRPDVVALSRQPVGERENQAGLVFHQEEAHRCMADGVMGGTPCPPRSPRPLRSSRSPGGRGRLIVNEDPARARVHGDVPAMRFDDALDEAETEAVAVNLLVDGVAAA